MAVIDLTSGSGSGDETNERFAEDGSPIYKTEALTLSRAARKFSCTPRHMDRPAFTFLGWAQRT